MNAPAPSVAVPAPSISIRNYAIVTAAYWAGVDDGAAKALRDTADLRQDSYAQGVVDTIAVAVAMLMVLAVWRLWNGL